MKRLLGKTRVYQALSFAYDEYAKRRHTPSDPALFRHVGAHSEIHGNVYTSFPGRIWVGEWSTVMGQVYIHAMGGVHIGNYVGIGYATVILTFNHRYRNARSIPFDDGVFLQPVIIRDFAWVGWNSTVLPGVEIGEGAIVSMGSVVTKNVPPLAIVQGNPAEIIGYRSRDHFEACKAEGRVNPHRVIEAFGKFDEIIPMMTRKRYEKELRDIGLIPEDEPPSANEG